MCGDLNQNATIQKHPAIEEFLNQITIQNKYTNIRPLIVDEYHSLIKAISNPNYTVIDAVR